MSQSLAHIIIHLVFSTKERKPILVKTIRDELYAYMAEVLQADESPAILINGTEDHVHVLFILSKTHALCEVIELVKKRSSKWIKTKGKRFEKFQWQSGYGAFSVSESLIDKVRQYIEDQESHHAKISFKDEMKSLLEKHGVKYDIDHIWT